MEATWRPIGLQLEAIWRPLGAQVGPRDIQKRPRRRQVSAKREQRASKGAQVDPKRHPGDLRLSPRGSKCGFGPHLKTPAADFSRNSSENWNPRWRQEGAKGGYMKPLGSKRAEKVSQNGCQGLKKNENADFAKTMKNFGFPQVFHGF